MLMEHCQGKTLEALGSLEPQDMLALFAAPLTITRQKCCLLSWRVLQAAMVCPPAPINRHALASGSSDGNPLATSGSQTAR
jgi:nitrogen fixation protein NifU and related proteins